MTSRSYKHRNTDPKTDSLDQEKQFFFSAREHFDGIFRPLWIKTLALKYFAIKVKTMQNSTKLAVKTAAIPETPDVTNNDAGYWTLIDSSERDEFNTEREIDVNVSENYTQTVVYIADQVATKNNDISAADGKIDLITAVKEGNHELVQSLIQAGADVNVTCEFGGTPLMYATGNVHNSCVSILLEAGASVNMSDVNGFTALHVAAWAGNNSVLNTILEAGADVNITDNKGTTPLIVATWEGNSTCMKVLIAEGADVNASEIDGITPLMSAVQTNHEECVRQLVKGGADVNAVDSKGFTALIAAAWTGNAKLVQMFLDAGAHVNRTNCRGQNALTFHVAQCDSVNKELVETLVEAGETLTVTSGADGERGAFFVRRFHDNGTASFLNLPNLVLELNSCRKFMRLDTQASS